ncbi:MAG: glycosyltransferase family 4 protein [SAR324 cluster bacterium]|nr:glycosyltransferase family 4 protein [SAR324 cluster bacterium]
MNVVFVSNYFPPEVNAPATRIYEHARQWSKESGNIEVITSVPNYPEGILHTGHQNQFSQETVEDILVTRVPMYIAENKGFLKRTLSYISFGLTAVLYCGRLHKSPDIVVATSPQLFGAIGGYVVSRLKKIPFVLEIRDLWPESIAAVGAVKYPWVIEIFEKVARYLYKQATRIIVVTDSFKQDLIEKGVDPEKITVIKNGADLEFFSQPLDPQQLETLREQHQLKDKFVVAYIGTIGLAHRADILLEAAQQCTNPNIVFVVIGAGAERERLEQKQAQLKLPNFRLIDKQPKALIPYFLEITDACVVHLKDTPLFQKVIPSKMFESMVMRKPVILGVRGESCNILKEAEAGIPIEPENVNALVDATMTLYNNKSLYTHMSNNGYNHVCQNYDRKKTAKRYWQFLESIVQQEASDAKNH